MSAPADLERAAAGGDAIVRLDAITRRLRRECPWDREQDERSIVPHTEEAYELADAAASGDDAKLADELGDVLFQVHFLALLLEERGAGDLAAVATGMTEKLIRRHPHVFADAEASDSGQVLANWDRIKQEREAARAPLRMCPRTCPRYCTRASCSGGRARAPEPLFACVDLARRLRCDPELALRAASERFRAQAGAP